MDAIQLELPLPMSVDEMYRDQSMKYINGESFYFFAAYTPWGIKQIDSDFIRRIRNFERNPEEVRREILKNYLEEKKRMNKEFFYHKESKKDRLYLVRFDTRKKLSQIGEDPKKLKDEILDNPYLHMNIKLNLIENFDRILADLGLNTEMNPCR